MIKVSFLMPIYNPGSLLVEAIESVLRQKDVSIELVCVNDGSTDNTDKILGHFASIDNRVVVINKSNSGTAAAARNAGLAYCSGEYIALLDADDVIDDQYVESLCCAMRKYSADIYIPKMIMFNDAFNSVIKELDGKQVCGMGLISGVMAFKLSLNWEIPGIGVYKRDLMNNVSCDLGWMNSDELLSRKLFIAAASIAFFDGIYYYRSHPTSTTKKNNLKKYDIVKTNLVMLEMIRKYAPESASLYLYEYMIVTIKLLIMLENEIRTIPFKKYLETIATLQESYYSLRNTSSSLYRMREKAIKAKLLSIICIFPFTVVRLIVRIVLPFKVLGSSAKWNGNPVR